MKQQHVVPLVVAALLAAGAAQAQPGQSPSGFEPVWRGVVTVSDGRNEGPDWIRCQERRRRGDAGGIERYCLPGY